MSSFQYVPEQGHRSLHPLLSNVSIMIRSLGYGSSQSSYFYLDPDQCRQAKCFPKKETLED
jgi:hypothetical protein